MKDVTAFLASPCAPAIATCSSVIVLVAVTNWIDVGSHRIPSYMEASKLSPSVPRNSDDCDSRRP